MKTEKLIFYHGTTEDAWREIQSEGILFGRRFVTDNDGNILKEVSRCTYLTPYQEEAEQYGDVLLEVRYNPYNRLGNIKKNKNRHPLNNYNPESWQMRVYEAIPLSDIKRIK